jgi:hypothetical protein
MTFHYTKGFRRDAPLIVDIASTFVCEDTRVPVLSCKCGRSHLADAALRARRDPTRTLDLRRKFIRTLEKRWKRISRLVTEAVATQDMFGLSLANAHALQIVAMSSGRVPAFQQWIDAALADTILGMDRELWIGGFIREAYQRGWTAATLQVGRDLPLNIDRADIITKLTIAELQGVIEAFSQRAVRAFSDGLMSHLPPATVARSIRKEVDKVGIVRSRMTVQTMIVRTNGEAALDAFQSAGRTHVDVLPETMPSPGRMHAIRDAKARSRRSRRRGVRSEFVEVLTAGDDDVCTICQDISESGPYAIADARGLIPAHPNCRCAFVPAYDKRFAHGDAWNEEDHPRAPDGKFGEVAYHGTISPFAKNILKEGLKTNSIGRVFLAKSKARALIEARKFVGSSKVKPVVFTLHVPKSQFKTFKNDPALPGKAVYRERDIPASWIVSHKVYKDADEEYVVVYAVILVPESELQDGIVWHDGFDPDEPRNERGEWTAEETIEMAKTQRELLAAIRAKKAGEQKGEAFINIPSPAQKIRNAEIMFGTGSPQHKAAIKKFGTKDEWNEEDHPRDPDGRFGAGSAARKEPTDKELVAIHGASLDKPLEGKERTALRNYVRVDYGPTNEALRHPERFKWQAPDHPFRVDEAARLKIMDGIFARTHLSRDMVTYRKVNEDVYASMEKHVGKTFIDKGFVSTSASINAEAVTAVHFNSEVAPKVVEVRIPKGAKALPISHLSRAGFHADEKEVLINRGTRFHVSKKAGKLIIQVHKSSLGDAAVDATVENGTRYGTGDLDRFTWGLDDFIFEDSARDEWNEEDHPREPAGGPGGGEFTGNGGDLASIAKKFDDSKEYAELSAKLNAGQITNKQFDKATGKLHDLNSIDVKVYRVGSAEMAPRGIHFGDSPQSIEAYTSIHPGQEIKEYRIEAGKTGVTRNHMTLHQHLFGSDFRNAVEAEDRRSGSKSYVAAAERVEGRMAKEARKRGYEAIIYTHPPLPAKHELVLLKKDAIVSADEATIVLTHGYRVVRGDGLKIGQIFRDTNEAKLARDVSSLDAGEGSQVWEVDVSDIEGAEADETAVYLPAGTSFEVVGFDQSRGVWNIDAR